MSLEETDILDERREFNEARQRGLFSTDGAKILLLSKYGSPRSVYADKTGTAPERPMSLPAWLGLKMQATVAELYMTAAECRVRADNRAHWRRDTDFPYGTHLDYRRVGQPGHLVECKTRAYMRGFGDEGTTEIPADVWVQVQHEMDVTGAERCDVAVLFGHHTFRIYAIARDDAFLAKYRPRLSAFWHNHVVALVPPLPTGHRVDTAEINANRGEYEPDYIRAATPEQELLIRDLRMADGNLAQVKEHMEGLKNRVKEMIEGAGAAGISGSFGTITWKRAKDSEEVQWDNVAQQYSNIIEDLLGHANPGDDPAEVARYAQAQLVYETAVGLATTITPGTARFLMNWR